MNLESLGNFFGSRHHRKKSDIYSPKGKKAKVLKVQSDTEKKLENIISKTKLVNTGQVHLLGLGEIKRDLGAKWPNLRVRILESLKSIIENRISSKDVFFSRSDEEHIIVFSDVSGDNARLICAKILQELSEVYLGSADTKNITVKTAVGKVNGRLLFEPKSMDQIFKDAMRNQESFEPETTENQPELQFSEVEMPYEVVYKPIWDVRNETISTYMVNTYNRDQFGNPNFGYDVLAATASAEAMIKVDFTVMNEIIDTLADLFQNNFRAIFCIPVCYETLFNTERLQRYLAYCQKIPKALRKYISFILVGFPVGVPETKLRFVVSNLRKYSRAVIVVCKDLPNDIAYYKNCGVKGISVEVPDMYSDVDEFWEKMSLICVKCRQQRLFFSVTELNRKYDLILAKEIRANFLSGDIIGPYRDTPGHMSRVSWQELISNG